MAKQQVRSPAQHVVDDPRWHDESSELWPREFGTVARGLLTSAVRCFASNGYHAATTRDISAGSSLSPAALYVHFPSKELLLYEIIRSSHESALASIQDPSVDELPGAAEKLHALMVRYTAWHARHHVAARVSQYELMALTKEHYEEILRIRRRTSTVFHNVVAHGVADGTFAAVPVNQLVRSMLSLSIDLVRWYRLDGPDSPEDLGRFYAVLALKMASNTSPSPNLPLRM